MMHDSTNSRHCFYFHKQVLWCHCKMSRFLNVLRSWLVMVSIIAMGNTVQSFRDHSFLSEKLYTGKPSLGKVIVFALLEAS